MINAVFFLIFVTYCNFFTCEISESELKTILSVLYSNNILEEYQDEVDLRIEEKTQIAIPKRIELQNKKVVKTNSEKKGIPFIALSNVQSYDTGIMKINFKVFKSTSRYRGEIVLKCVDDNLIFEDIHYLSEID